MFRHAYHSAAGPGRSIASAAQVSGGGACRIVLATAQDAAEDPPHPFALKRYLGAP
jgi:hypothetical protein